jgi:hypothetical protein
MKMGGRVPIVTSISWWATIPQFAALAICCAVGYWLLRSPRGVMVGAAVYLAYSFGSRSLIPWYHRRGVRLSRHGRFAEAIPQHQTSYDFFTRHAWLDRYRAIVMMSPSAMSFREMALLNIAFAYAQLGDGAKAKEFYRRALEEFPGSAMAVAALRMIDAAESAVSH